MSAKNTGYLEVTGFSTNSSLWVTVGLVAVPMKNQGELSRGKEEVQVDDSSYNYPTFWKK